MINPYLYSKHNDGCRCDLEEDQGRWSHYVVTIPSAWESKYLGNSPIRAEYLVPHNTDKAPLAILIHGMGERSIKPCRMIAHTLAKKGIASLILYLVFHSNRGSKVVREKYPKLSAEEWFESYQISVTDIRQALDWAVTRPEILSDKISIVGISYGGFVSSIAMALDQRIKAGVLIVSGGNSEKMTKYGLLLRLQYKIKDEEYLRNQKAYTEYLAEVEEKGFENVVAGKSSYLTDPKTFAKYIKKRPILMLNAFWDEMIPRNATLDYWESIGKPRIRWYPATHASIWMWYPWMRAEIIKFLTQSLQ